MRAYAKYHARACVKDGALQRQAAPGDPILALAEGVGAVDLQESVTSNADIAIGKKGSAFQQGGQYIAGHHLRLIGYHNTASAGCTPQPPYRTDCHDHGADALDAREPGVALCAC